jgi:hypothetical protein
MKAGWQIFIVCLYSALAVHPAASQQPPAQPQPGAPGPRGVAPIDLTGYWTAVITEDWRFRMVTPPKGDFVGIPLNAAGQKAAQAWDPAKDVASGEQCKAYGAAGVMRLPTRLRVSWDNDTTLKVETDAGQQVRLFRFGQPRQGNDVPRDPQRGGSTANDWQGNSVAEWETMPQGQGQAPPGGGGGGGGGGGQAPPALSGSLKVVTSRMRPGYMRRNGVPYSDQAILTEYLDRVDEPNGDSWLVVTSSLDDPMNLAQPYMLSTHFKREPDGSKWNPRPCEVVPPAK